MTYAIMVRHGTLGDIIVDILDDLEAATLVCKEFSGSWIEDITRDE